MPENDPFDKYMDLLGAILRMAARERFMPEELKKIHGAQYGSRIFLPYYRMALDWYNELPPITDEEWEKFASLHGGEDDAQHPGRPGRKKQRKERPRNGLDPDHGPADVHEVREEP